MPDAKAVLLTHNETSTGVMNPIAELAAAIREETPEALILVDSVSGLGAVPFEMDDWGVDVVVTGSQKAWMAAPGPRDDRRVDARLGRDGDRDACRASTSTCGRTATPRPTGQTPFTPAIAVVYQVDEGLRLMAAEGAESIFARHEACAAAARAGLAALGFELFADPRHASKTVTAANVPDDLDWKAFNCGGQAARRRARRRPGQADRQDLPPRPPRLGHARGDPRRAEHARVRGPRPAAGPSRRARPSPRRRSRRSSRTAVVAGTPAGAGA